MKIHRYWVYILSNKNNTVLYVGVTNDVYLRVNEHRECMNKNSFTFRYNVHKLVYYVEFSEIDEAIKFEKQLKRWKREWKDNLIDHSNPDRIDLMSDFMG